MPTSPWQNIPRVIGQIMELSPRPTKLLDVGIGYGKYGLLCREYLSFWNSPNSVRPVVIDGIEAFPDYIRPLQTLIYDQIFVGEACAIASGLPSQAYDVALLIDVIEHFDKQAGVEVLTQLRRVAKVVIVSTPKQFWPQQDSWGNPYERHRSLWRPQDFSKLGANQVVKDNNWIAVFAVAEYAWQFSASHNWRLRAYRLRRRLQALIRP